MMDNSEFDFENTFPPLGHPEHHFNKFPDHPWLKTKEDIIKWMMENLSHKREDGDTLSDFEKAEKVIEKCTIHEDMTVSFFNVMSIKESYHDIKYLPIQIRRVNIIEMDNIGLRTLIGSPYCCIKLSANKNNIENVTGMPKKVRILQLNINLINKFEEFKESYKLSSLDLRNNPIESLSNFPASEILMIGNEYENEVDCHQLLLTSNLKSDSIMIEKNNPNYFEVLINGDKELPYGCVDMVWLKSEKENIEKIEENYKNIKNSSEDSIDSKKRKRKL